MIVVPAAPLPNQSWPILGFDCDVPLSASTASAFVANNYRFVVRYVSRGAPEDGDLTVNEISAILDSGLALMVVQHAPDPGWIPTEASGTQWGTAMADNIRALGLPAGATGWKDHEGVATGVTEAAISEHINAWSEAITGVVQPGLYVGYDSGYADGNALYYDLSLDRYWKSASNVPSPMLRGFCMQQSLSGLTIAGVSFDINFMSHDALGGIPNWIISG